MSRLFQPCTIGSLTLKNRMIHSATLENMADEYGRVTPSLIRRYATLAKGEIGLIIPGHMYVLPNGKAHHRQVGIYRDDMVQGLRDLVDAVHENGSKIAFQITHGGRQSPRQISGYRPIAPSGHGRDPVSMNKPLPMDNHQINDTVQAFADAARRAAEAGADAIQIHGAHGYLISEFLSPFFNRRTDDYGGSDENRFRFLKEIFMRIRDVVPASMPILTKLNVNDHTPSPGTTPELAASVARRLVDLGIDAIEISCGTDYGFHTIRGDIPVGDFVRYLPLWMKPLAAVLMKLQAHRFAFNEAYNHYAAGQIKAQMGEIPLILVGGIRRLQTMEAILDSNEVDMISMSRPFIREPMIMKHFQAGAASAVACESCNKCLAAIFGGLPLACYRKGIPA